MCCWFKKICKYFLSIDMFISMWIEKNCWWYEFHEIECNTEHVIKFQHDYGCYQVCNGVDHRQRNGLRERQMVLFAEILEGVKNLGPCLESSEEEKAGVYGCNNIQVYNTWGQSYKDLLKVHKLLFPLKKGFMTTPFVNRQWNRQFLLIE